MFQPRPVILEPPAEAKGNWFLRSLRALVAEQRLPTTIAIKLDRLLIRFGRPLKRVSAGGCRFYARRQTSDEHFIREVATDETYFPRNYGIEDGDTVVDIGGNIGSFAIQAAKRASHGRVISVEPVSGNFELLKRNKELNGAENLTILKAAVTDQPGRVSIFLCDDGQGSHSIDNSLAGSNQYEEVEGLTLEQLLDRYQVERCQFLKMDCEGAEFPIVDQLTQSLADRIDKIAMEYHANEGDKHDVAMRLLTKLTSLGYTIDDYTDIVDTPYGLIFARRA